MNKAILIISVLGLMVISTVGPFFGLADSEVGNEFNAEVVGAVAGVSVGNPIWNFSTAASDFQASPTYGEGYGEGTIYIGSGNNDPNNNLYAIDAETGKKEWNFSTNSNDIPTSPAVAGSKVFFGTRGNRFYAVNAFTGEEEWRISLNGGVIGSPTVESGTVYFGSADGDNTMYAVDTKTGNVEWMTKAPDQIKGDVTYKSESLYVGTENETLYSFDADTGNIEWKASTGGDPQGAPSVVDGTVYVTSELYNENEDQDPGDPYGWTSGNVTALNADTGQEEWSLKTGEIDGSPTVYDGLIYVGTGSHSNGSRENSVLAIDTDTGNVEWEYKTTGGATGTSPTVAGGTVYFGSYGDSSETNLYAVDAKTGVEKWSYTNISIIDSGPLVVDGVLYIASFDSNVYAFETGHMESSNGSRVKLKSDGYIERDLYQPISGISYNEQNPKQNLIRGTDNGSQPILDR